MTRAQTTEDARTPVPVQVMGIDDVIVPTGMYHFSLVVEDAT